MRVLTLTLLVLPTLAGAQDVDGADQGRKVKYAERTEISFTELSVTSELVRPSGTLVNEPRRVGFAPMFDLRTSFETELRESVLQVR
jgi:hypothetical protein